jgi:hypothetical protein
VLEQDEPLELEQPSLPAHQLLPDGLAPRPRPPDSDLLLLLLRSAAAMTPTTTTQTTARMVP